jgi:hypothetical protein
MLGERSGNARGTFRECSGKAQGMVRECLGPFRECLGNARAILGEGKAGPNLKKLTLIILLGMILSDLIN